MDTLIVHEVDQHRWEDFQRLFEAPGGPKSCWCTVWLALGPGRSKMRGPQRKAAMRQRVENEIPVGLLGYLNGVPSAWCALAPRRLYRNLGGPAQPDGNPDAIWSIVCMYVPRALRQAGLSQSLIDAAVAHARSRNAEIVEAYPVAPDSPSYRFMGFIPTFEAAGFHHVGEAGSRRKVMRKYLGSR